MSDNPVLIFDIPDVRFERVSIAKDSNGERYDVYELTWTGQMNTTCPECHSKLHRHGTRVVTVIASPIDGMRCLYRITYPRYRCINENCGKVYLPEISGLALNNRITYKAALDIASRLINSSLGAVVRRYAVSKATLSELFLLFFKEFEWKLRWPLPSFIGFCLFESKSVGRRLAVLDLEQGTVYDLLSDDKEETVRQWCLEQDSREDCIVVYSTASAANTDLYKEMFSRALICIPRQSLRDRMEEKLKGKGDETAEIACAEIVSLLDSSPFREKYMQWRQSAASRGFMNSKLISNADDFIMKNIDALSVEDEKSRIFVSTFTECMKILDYGASGTGRKCSFETLRLRLIYQKMDIKAVLANEYP